ncbi:MAG TPA: lipoyl synthase [Candidatus Hydrogenedentes bacterium]|nr:lipoyl synthase [Candidatus Hydrogenedentota bacterium]
MNKGFPEWIRQAWGAGPDFRNTRELIEDLGLHTVCQSARCPNRGQCWRRNTATFMILGDVCTRNCAYCAVRNGPPAPVQPDEPERVAEAVRRMRLKHAVVTSVTRDDLADGGASYFAQTIQAIRHASPGTVVEVLTPDFGGAVDAVSTVLQRVPDVFGHNVETVPRLYPSVRGSAADYARSLEVLKWAANFTPKPIVKSAFMVGHGESRQEVRETLEDLVAAGCVAVCIGQYLRPTPSQREVVEFVPPQQFEEYDEMARALGFEYVAAAPLVRSSYWADRLIAAPFAETPSPAVREV